MVCSRATDGWFATPPNEANTTSAARARTSRFGSPILSASNMQRA